MTGAALTLGLDAPVPVTTTISEAGLTTIALHESGYTLTETGPDFVVLGETRTYTSKATGREPYFVGKPNPMVFRIALNRIEAHSESTVMVGHRMDTDVVAGIEAGLETILVLTG